MNNQQRGDLTGVVWIPQGLGQGAALAVKDQDLDLSALLLDVTSVLSGGYRARLGGLGDAESDVKAVYDADASPYLAVPNIVPGAGGLMLFAITVGATRNFQVPMRVEKLHWVSGVETAVMWSFHAKMDSRIGNIVYPSA
jgi:hypothetical protein